MKDTACRIGCGYAHCRGKRYPDTYVCNYLTGQYDWKTPFEPGEPCAKCSDHCEENALCGAYTFSTNFCVQLYVHWHVLEYVDMKIFYCRWPIMLTVKEGQTLSCEPNWCIIIVRNSSCGKVMFSQGECLPVGTVGCTPLQSWAETPSP